MHLATNSRHSNILGRGIMFFLWAFIVLFVLWIIGLAMHFIAAVIWVLLVLWIISLVLHFVRRHGGSHPNPV